LFVLSLIVSRYVGAREANRVAPVDRVTPIDEGATNVVTIEERERVAA